MMNTIAIGNRIAALSAAVFLCVGGAGAATGETSGVREIRLPLRIMAGNSPLQLHEPTLKVPGEHQVAITRIEFLISGVRLRRTDGAYAELRDQYFHVDPTENEPSLLLQNVPCGSFDAVEFCVGVNSSINHQDPARWPAGHALNVLESNLHWGWQNGYVFLALEGYVAGEQGKRTNFVYHLGNDENLMKAAAKIPASLYLADAELVLHADKIFTGKSAIDPTREEGVTHSAKGDALAPRLARNIEQSFEVRKRVR